MFKILFNLLPKYFPIKRNNKLVMKTIISKIKIGILLNPILMLPKNESIDNTKDKIIAS